MGHLGSKPQGRRRPRRTGGATKDAERRALAKANARPDRPVARSDSRLLIGHVSGERHIRNARLLELEAQITDRRMRIGTVLFEWIPATANADAHRLVAGVLGSAEG